MFLMLFSNLIKSQIIADRFDYPIGDRGLVNDQPYEFLERISPEKNNLFPNNPPLTNSISNRSGTSISNDWYNISDVGNFVSGLGIHPGEDWNFGGRGMDAGKEVFSTANGTIVGIVSTSSKGYKVLGWTIIIKHITIFNKVFYSIYTHITSSNNSLGDLTNSKNDFLTSIENYPFVTRGQLIARVSKGNEKNNGIRIFEKNVSIDTVPSHLHFEIRDACFFTFPGDKLWKLSNGNGYYGANPKEAFDNMKTDGILDPSDFIESNRFVIDSYKPKSQTFIPTTSGINTSDWNYTYVKQSVENGFFNNSASFNSSSNLTKGGAAKIIVRAAIKCGVKDAFNESFSIKIPQNPINGIDACNDLYDYVQTLKYNNYLNETLVFNPDEEITVGEFCDWIAKVFRIPANSTPNVKSYVSRVQIDNSALYASQIKKVANLFYLNNYDLGALPFIQNISAFLMLSTQISQGNGTLIYTGTAKIKRGHSAKLLMNAYNYRLQNASNARLSSVDMSKVTVIGDKPEFESNSNSEPVTIDQNTTINMLSGQKWEFYYPSDLDSKGNPLFFYWAVTDGILESKLPNHRKVVFTAPNVSQLTEYNIYAHYGNFLGKTKDALIVINVSPSGGGTATTTSAPTLSASNLQFSNVTSSSLTLNWTNGNGQGRLVTCVETSPYPPDSPQNNTYYSQNSNFQLAPNLFSYSDTKVMYVGAGSSVNILGLSPNTTYRFDVIEYNGSSSDTKYNVNNAAYAYQNTLNVAPPIPATSAAFGLATPYMAQTNNTFYNNSSNFIPTTYYWTFTGANVQFLTTYNIDPITNVYWNTSGNYEVILQAVNSNGTSILRKRTVAVQPFQSLTADLIVESMIVTPQNSMVNTPISITGYIKNQGLDNYTLGQVLYTSFYFSTDNILDAGDFEITRYGQSGFPDQLFFSNNINQGEFVPFSISFNTSDYWPAYYNNGNRLPGNYYIIAKVDNNNLVQEGNESNNTYAFQINLQEALPDYIIEPTISMNPSNLKSGSTLSLNYTLNNIGPGGASSTLVYYFLSTDLTLSSDDINLYTDYASLGNRNVSIKIPSSTKDGNYYILIAANHNSSQAETNKSNNVRASSAIVVTSPNQPSQKATNLFLTNITNSSVRLNWTNGNGSGRIVIVSKGSAAEDNATNSNNGYPFDGCVYTSSGSYLIGQNVNYAQPWPPAIQSSRVVYNGNSNSVNISGLENNEIYYFSVWEYGGSGVSIDYLQDKNEEAVIYMDNPKTVESNYVKIINKTCDIRNIQHFGSSIYAFNVCGNQFIKSTDSGISWNIKQWLPGEYQFFINSLTGWTVGQYGNISKTSDAGITWTSQQIGNSNLSLKKIHFIDNNTGYLIGDQFEINTYYYKVFKTTNGGNSWDQIYIGNKQAYGLFFINSQTGFVSSYDYMLNKSELRKTIDGGLSWIAINYPTIYPIQDIIFKNTNIGFAIDNRSQIIKTTDGGITWRIVSNLEFNNYSLSTQIRYFNNTLYAINRNLLLKSTDEGETWIIVPQNEIFTSIGIKNESELYFGTSNGIIYSSLGGMNYNSINQPIISSNKICTGNSNLNYVAFGTYSGSNLFKVELSNNSGEFTSPIVIGSLSSSSISGIINISIPSNINAGSGYSFRITASNPSVIGINLANVTILSNVNSNIINLDPEYELINQNVTVTGIPTGGVLKINSNTTNILNPQSLGLGVHTVNYNLTQSCGSSIKSFSVVPAFNISISGIGGSYCSGTTIGINYQTSRIFNSDNIFSVEMSDENGSFALPLALGQNNSSVSGSINISVPLFAKTSSNYRLRVNASSPTVIGVSSSLFSITASQIPTSKIVSYVEEECISKPIFCWIPSVVGHGMSPTYQWFLNDSPIVNTAYPNFLHYMFNQTLPSGFNKLHLQITTSGTCVSQNVVTTNSVFVNIIEPVTPELFIDTESFSTCEGDTIRLRGYEINSGDNSVIKWKVNNVFTTVIGNSFKSNLLTNNASVLASLSTSGGCLSINTVTSNSFQVQKYSKPIAIISSSGTNLCPEGLIEIKINTLSGYSYNWLINDNYINNELAILNLDLNYISQLNIGTSNSNGNGTVSGGNTSTDSFGGRRIEQSYPIQSVVNNNGCTSISNPISINIISKDVIQTTYEKGNLLGQTISGFNNYYWLNQSNSNTIFGVATKPSSIGQYQFYATDEYGCLQKSEVVTITSLPTSLGKYNDFEVLKVEIYPNPTENEFFIEASTPLGYEVVDVLGKVVRFTNEKQTRHKVSGLHTGVYFVKVENTVHKIVVR